MLDKDYHKLKCEISAALCKKQVIFCILLDTF